MPRLLFVLVGLLLVSCSEKPAQESPASAGSFAPHLSRSGERIVLSWLEPDSSGSPTLRFSERSGGRWAPARSVGRDPNVASDGADVPGVVPLGGSRLAAYWTIRRGASTVARNLVVSVSADDGVSWSAATSPHHDDTDSEHAMASIVPTGASGEFGIVWLDGRAGASADYGIGGTSLYWADWRGGAFAPELLLDPRVCDCCKTSAAWTAEGPIIAYRDRSESEHRDIATIRRQGGAWSAPTGVHEDGWAITACPTNGPAVASREQHVAVAWFTSANATPSVWAVLSGDEGKTFGERTRLDGGAPVGRVNAALLADGSAAVVWLERKGADATVRVRRVSPEGRTRKPTDIATTSPSRASGYPTIVAVDSGGVLVAWTETSPARRVRVEEIQVP